MCCGVLRQPNEDCDQTNETRWQGLRFQQDIAEGCGRQGRDAPTHDKVG